MTSSTPPPAAPAAWADPFAPDELGGRVCLVTGAARGIGGAVAQALAALGGRAAWADLALQGAQAKARELTDAGLSAAAFALDVRDTAAVDAAIDAIAAQVGPVDVLVNNAGLFILTETVDVPDADWEL